ncbi:MAG: thioredoxin family protein [Thermoanaerobaculia bacterium]|nr:thioredoxin family protein [Thermoanaerobaculia bacterium]
MKTLLRPSTLALAVALTAAAAAAQPPPGKARLELAADRTAYEPGSTARIAARIVIEPGWHVNSHRPTYDWLIASELALDLPEGWPPAEISYPEGVLRRFAFEREQPLSVYEGTTRVTAEVRVPEAWPEGPAAVVATLTYQACDDRSCLPPTEATASLELTVGPGGVATGATEPSAPRGAGGRALAVLVLLGIAGGLILNAMPCVLPVLSLKLFGLVQSGTRGRREVVLGSLATAAGILVSFWALAAAAVIARAAGATVGWGVQFQEPVFVVLLTVIVLLFSLNLWGLFEVPLPARLAGLAGSGREGLPGHFTSGLFATLMATPCSAPFLGTAVGFALAQPGPAVFGMFTAVGFGMALPYLMIAVSPGLLRWIPKPGAWMESLKIVMGFLLAGAALWLLYVLAGQVSRERLAFVELALLVLTLCVWAGARANRRRGRLLAATGLLVAAAAALALAAGGRGETAASAAPETRLIDWVVFDRAEAERLAREEARPVFVDVTADWCFTCKVNERLVLETPEIARLFEDHGVVPMRADWTNRDDGIAAFLADHGRYGIPFYLLYRPGREPHLFSELLTKGAVREAVEEATGLMTARAE